MCSSEATRRQLGRGIYDLRQLFSADWDNGPSRLAHVLNAGHLCSAISGTTRCLSGQPFPNGNICLVCSSRKKHWRCARGAASVSWPPIPQAFLTTHFSDREFGPYLKGCLGIKKKLASPFVLLDLSVFRLVGQSYAIRTGMFKCIRKLWYVFMALYQGKMYSWWELLKWLPDARNLMGFHF